jgi:hypothetical protein
MPTRVRVNAYVGHTWNGPWAGVAPTHVPMPLLRVPVRYYRVPPPHWRPARLDCRTMVLQAQKRPLFSKRSRILGSNPKVSCSRFAPVTP